MGSMIFLVKKYYWRKINNKTVTSLNSVKKLSNCFAPGLNKNPETQYGNVFQDFIDQASYQKTNG